MSARNILSSLLILTGCVVSSPAVNAGETSTTGYVSDVIGQANYVEKQIVALEQAIPQDKFTWRPAEGVRSISEVYLHVAGGNYYLLTLAGYKPPRESNFTGNSKMWEAQTTDRDEIARVLKASFDYFRNIASGMSAEDLEKKVDYFGTELTVRSLLMSVLSHQHEHLGQSIAYARMNGIVPPWTAARQMQTDSK